MTTSSPPRVARPRGRGGIIARWGPGPGHRTALLADVAAVAFTMLLRWWLVRGRVMYSGSSDEASQLAMARDLAGGTPFRLAGASFDAGYAALLAPVQALVPDDPELFFRLALVVNVVLAGVTLVVLRALVVRLSDLDGPWATWSAAVALALPGAAMQTPYAAAECLVALVVVVVLLLAVRLVSSDGGAGVAVSLAGVAGLLPLVHARLAGVSVTVAIVLVVVSLAGQVPTRIAGLAIVVLGLTGWAALAFDAWVYDLVWLARADDAERLSSTVQRLFDPRAVALSLSGMVWHQLVTTVGLAVVGLAHLVVLAVGTRGERPRPDVRARRALVVLVLLAAATAPAAVFMSGPRLASHMVYGRYWDAIAIPVVAIGTVHLLAVGRRRATWLLGTAALVTAAVGVVFALVRQGAIDAAFLEHGFGNERRIAGLLAWLRLGERIDVLAITAMAVGLVVLVAALVAVAGRWAPHHVVVLVVLVLAATGTTVRASLHLSEKANSLTRWRPVTALVEDGILPPGATVAFQRDQEAYTRAPADIVFTAYQFYEPDVEFVGMVGEEVLDADWVVSDARDPMMEDAGWELVWRHPEGRGVGLWAPP